MPDPSLRLTQTAAASLVATWNLDGAARQLKLSTPQHSGPYAPPPVCSSSAAQRRDHSSQPRQSYSVPAAASTTGGLVKSPRPRRARGVPSAPQSLTNTLNPNNLLPTPLQAPSRPPHRPLHRLLYSFSTAPYPGRGSRKSSKGTGASRARDGGRIIFFSEAAYYVNQYWYGMWEKMREKKSLTLRFLTGSLSSVLLLALSAAGGRARSGCRF